MGDYLSIRRHELRRHLSRSTRAPGNAAWRRWLAGACLASLSGTLAAHDFWVEPHRFTADVGDHIQIQLYEGQRLRGVTLPFIPHWFSRFELIDPQGARAIHSDMGDDPAALIRVRNPGSNWVLYRSNRNVVALEADKFHSYLRDEGLEFVIALREAAGQSELPVREYYSRCAKSLITVGAGPPAQAGAMDFGMTLELVPLSDPAALRPGEPLALWVRYRDDPLPGALVVAFRRDEPEQIVAGRTDAKGRVSLPLEKSGIWLVKVVHMIPVEDDPTAEWESFWASMTFAVQ